MPGAPRAAGRGAEAKPGGQEFESRHLRTRVREELEERGERAGVCASAGCPGPRRRHRLRREGKGGRGNRKRS